MKKTAAFGVVKFRGFLVVASISMVIEFLMGLADSVIAGNLLGETALAGLNLLQPPMNLVSFFACLIGTGTAICFSFETGRFRHERACEMFSQGFWSAVLLGGCGVLALGDVSRAVFFKIEVTLTGILHAFHAGAQLAHTGFEGVLHAGDWHNAAVVEALGAVAGQVFADADGAAALGIQRGVYDAAAVLAQGAAQQEAVAVHGRAGQHLDLRNRSAGVPAAMGADGIAAHILEAVHTQVFVSHIFHSFGGKFRNSASFTEAH
jgi:hypothetical protein